MTRIIDNLIAYRILSMIVMPFEETDAYKLGIIDKNGNNLIKTSKLKTSQERDAYTYLNRLVFNIKKILNKLPGGESKTKNLIAALWLVKESYVNKTNVFQEDFIKLLDDLDRVTLVEEEIEVNKFLDQLHEDGAPANVTGANVSTDIAVPSKSDIEKYKKKNTGVISLVKRNKPIL
jgi:hypothetical protein